MRIRMLPIGSVFNRFPRLVHDLERKLDKRVKLELHGEGTELDKTVLEKIGDPLVHLVRNAIDAGAAGVQLRTRVEHGARIGEDLVPLALRLDVGDDGRGVPQELAEQIFLPLVSGRADGTGLGLALAQQVAREHRGSLTYRSRPGHTVFTLLLPMPAENGDAG